MKFVCVLLCAVAAAACVTAQIPIKKCPPGEHSVLYCPQKAEPDCETPSVHPRPGGACGIPDCFCDNPTVRDLSTGRCIPLNQCPKNIKQ